MDHEAPVTGRDIANKLDQRSAARTAFAREFPEAVALMALTEQYQADLREGRTQRRKAKVRNLPFWPKEDMNWQDLEPTARAAYAERRVMVWLDRVRSWFRRYPGLPDIVRPDTVIKRAQSDYRTHSGGAEIDTETLRASLRGIWGPGLPDMPKPPSAPTARVLKPTKGIRRQPSRTARKRRGPLPQEPMGTPDLREVGRGASAEDIADRSNRRSRPPSVIARNFAFNAVAVWRGRYGPPYFRLNR